MTELMLDDEHTLCIPDELSKKSEVLNKDLKIQLKKNGQVILEEKNTKEGWFKIKQYVAKNLFDTEEENESDE